MTISAAKLMVEIGADTQKAVSGIRAAGNEIDSFGKKVSSTGMKLTASITAPTALIGNNAIHMAADYDSAMGVLRATTGATDVVMSQFDELAKDLGADLELPGTSAVDATEAFLELSKAGIKVKDTFSGARGVLEMAAAGELNNAQAAEIAANALNAFNLEGEKTSYIADLMAGAANASSAEIIDIADAYQMSSAVFANANMDIEDLTVSIAMMSNAGIQGSDAGTSLKQAVLSLQNPTDKAKELMDQYGISIYDVRGNMLAWEEIIDQFSTKLSGLTEEQRNAALGTIFGSDAIRAAMVVMMNGSDAYFEMRDSVLAQADASKLAAAQMEGLNGVIENLTSATETAMLAAVEPFREDIIELVDSVTEGINSFSELDEETRKNIVSMIGLAAGVGPALLAIGGITSGVGKLITVAASVTPAVVGVTEGFALMAGGAGTVFEVATMSLAGFTAAALPAVAAIAAIGIAYKHYIVDTVEAGNDMVNSTYVDFFEKQVESGKSAIEIANEYADSQARINEALSTGAGERYNISLKNILISQETMAANNKLAGETILQTADNYVEYARAMEAAGIAADMLSRSQWSLATGIDYSYDAMKSETDQLKEFLQEIGNTGPITEQASEDYDALGISAEDAARKIGEIINAQISLEEQLKNASNADLADVTWQNLKKMAEVNGDPGFIDYMRQVGLELGYLSEQSIALADAQPYIDKAVYDGIIPIEDYTEALSYLNSDAWDGVVDIQTLIEKFSIDPAQVQPWIDAIGDISTGLDGFSVDGITAIDDTNTKLAEIGTTAGTTSDEIQNNFIQPTIDNLSTLANETMPPLVETITGYFGAIRDSASEAASQIAGISAQAAALKEWADNNTIEISVNVNQSGSIPTGYGSTTTNPEEHAIGGSVYAGRQYIVGERGEEPFFPAVNGRILSNAEAKDALAGGGKGNTYNISIQGGEGQSTVSKLMREMRRQEVLHG